MKNELNEYILSRIIIDLSKIKKILEDETNAERNEEAGKAIDELLAKVQEIE